MSTPRGSLPYTREACLDVLGLGPNDDVPENIARAFRAKSKDYHPDTGGTSACKAKLNQVVHARNMLCSGTYAYGEGGNSGAYGNQWGGYPSASGSQSAHPSSRYGFHGSPHTDPLGLGRFQSLGARRFAGNVRLGLLVALFGTGITLAYARATADRRKKERSPRLRRLMGLTRDEPSA